MSILVLNYIIGLYKIRKDSSIIQQASAEKDRYRKTSEGEKIRYLSKYLYIFRIK